MGLLPLIAPPSGGAGVAFVTGAGGFIGRHVTCAFKRAGWTVAGLSRQPSNDDGLGLTGPDGWVTGKISRLGLKQALARFGRPEVIVHAAGGASVRASLHDPREDFERTVGSMQEVLDFLRSDSPATRLIFLSSAAVYGCANAGRIQEDATLRPISPYGVHKRLAEELCLGWARLFDLDVAAVRLFSVYGPGIRKQLLWDVARRLCVEPRSVELFGTGDELRDFLYVDDVVQLISLLTAMERPDQPLLLNGGSGEGSSVSRVAQHLCEALGVETRVRFNGVLREGDPRSLVADTGLARSLGFQPRIGLREGLARFAAWARAEVGDGSLPLGPHEFRGASAATEPGI